MTGRDQHLHELAASVSDGAPVDWEREEREARDPEDRGLVRALRDLATISGAHHDWQHESAGGALDRAGQPPAAAAAAGAVGDMASHYRVLEVLGGGGMGVVYKAEDTRLGRPVALKFLPPELTRDPHAKARFLQEARAASALDHPNICTIHEVGETADGQLFLAMACYEGETLKRRLERGALPLAEVIDFSLQAARGLAKAHGRGIVHRDVKPANLMLTGDGIVKILDFGIAKLAGATTLTRAGSLLGTPAYMSPEQAFDDEVDARTDL
ncbi:MAG TPA: serine/threonine-protein kinase, partial [Thermoanaerobaculia bacterium]|nr:serine/threonine-protein kinase [Thermoanaerobaculia bacterium]